MIVSASRRTDIPAFYAKWFVQRLRSGFCEVANPFNPAQVSRVSLLPRDLDGIVFWTRNPGPLLPYLPELDQMGIAYYFLVTLLDYPQAVEPGSPPLEQRIQAFARLCEAIGPERVIWRYDPIALGPRFSIDFHLATHSRLAGTLRGLTGQCIVSFLTAYRKIAKRLTDLKRQGLGLAVPTLEEAAILIRGLTENCAANAMTLRACACPPELLGLGLAPASCIDATLLESLSGRALAPAKDPHQREHCHCSASKDIGAYDSCGHACVYCYATRGAALARANLARHDPESPSLLGKTGEKG